MDVRIHRHIHLDLFSNSQQPVSQGQRTSEQFTFEIHIVKGVDYLIPIRLDLSYKQQIRQCVQVKESLVVSTSIGGLKS